MWGFLREVLPRHGTPYMRYLSVPVRRLLRTVAGGPGERTDNRATGQGPSFLQDTNTSSDLWTLLVMVV